MSDAARRAAAAYRSAAPGTLVALHRAVKTRMEEIAEAFWGFSTKTSTRAPIVHHADLPRKANSAEERYPFMVVRPSRQGTDSVEGADQDSKATIEVEIGTYSDTEDGDLDLLAVVDAIRLSLHAKPIIEGTAFVHAGPLTWDVPFPQPRPEWLGIVTTVWNLPRPWRVD